MAKRKRSARPKSPAAPAVTNRYDAAGHGRRLRGWIAPASGPNRAISGGAETLRNRARDAGRNEWSAKTARTRWSVNLVGTGIVPRPVGLSAADKEALTSLWDEWSPLSDAAGVLDFYGLEAMVAGAFVESGEAFVRLRTRRADDALPVPLQLQVLESDMVPMWDSFARNGNPIRSGIEFDRLGRRAAYWMHREHPGDGIAFAPSDLVRVPADAVLHIFEPQRPGQIRGVTDFASILAKLRGVGDFDDAVLDRQKLANLFAFFVTRPPGGSAGIDPVTGEPLELDGDGGSMAQLQPGTGQYLDAGEDIKFSEPPGPGADYDDYMRIQSQHLAAGSSLPYELLTGDLRDVSDRALRVMINEFRRHCEQRQWHILIHQLCRPVRAAWAQHAVLSGAIAPALEVAAGRALWVPQGWAYIHPTQDVEAEKIAIDAGLKSRSQVITRRGDDPETIDQERADDAARERRHGLAAASATGSREATARNGGSSAERSPVDSRARSSDAQRDLRQELRMPDVHVRAGDVHVSLPPAQMPEVHNHLPAQSTEIHNHLPEPRVTVENNIDVDPAPVHVTNTMPPPQVDVHLPARKVRTTVERDGAGDIVSATQIETDADPAELV